MTSPGTNVVVRLHDRGDLAGAQGRWEAFVARRGPTPLSYHPGWLAVMERGLGHTPYCIEAGDEAGTLGLLPLACMRSPLFGRFLVGLPYLNYGGVIAEDPAVARLLVDRAVELADALDVRFLELRHERAIEHPSLTRRSGDKVHMRLPLPATPGALWDALDPKVRNQVRKGSKAGLTVAWGGEELLGEFYSVFSRNMRDLGTPVFGPGLFREVLRQFPGRAELCVVRAEGAPVASAVLLHGWGIAEVPSASSLRSHGATCCNMLLYWCLLERAAQRGQATFDFGRSSPGSGTFQFKKQWRALPDPAEWQFYVRKGTASDMRPDNPGYGGLIRLWKRLPVPLTRWIGPPIVRGIP